MKLTRYQSIFKFIFALSMSVIVISCSSEKVDRSPDEPKQISSFEPSEVRDLKNLKAIKNIEELYKNRDLFWAVIENKKTSVTTIYDKVLKKLDKVILSIDYVMNPNLNDREDFKEVLLIYNTAIKEIIVRKTKKEDNPILNSKSGLNIKLNDYLKKYSEILLHGCSKTHDKVMILKGCRTLEVFSKNYLTSYILTNIAASMSKDLFDAREQYDKERRGLGNRNDCYKDEGCKNKISTYQKLTSHFFVLLRLGIKLSNYSLETSTKAYFNLHLKDYQNYYLMMPEEERRNSKFNNLNCSIFSIFSKDLDIKKSKDKDLEKRYQDRMSDVDLSIIMHPTSKEAFCLKNQKQIQLDWFNSQLVQEGKVDRDGKIKDYIINYQSQISEKFKNKEIRFLGDAPYSMALGKVKEDRVFYKSLKLKELDVDIYFFLVNELFYGRIESDTFSEIWNMLPVKYRDNNILYKTINQFLRVQVAYNTILTNLHIRDYFTGSGSKNAVSFIGKYIFDLILKHGADMEVPWKNFLERVGNISITLEGVVRSKEADKRSKKYIDFVAQKDKLYRVRRDINLISTVPNMLILSYFLAKYEGSLEVNLWWFGKVTVDMSKVVGDILEGGLDTLWFYFGDGGDKLSKYEVLHAFDYALKSNIFNVYREANQEDEKGLMTVINEEVFFKRMLEKYIFPFKREIEKALRNIENTFPISDKRDIRQWCEYSSGNLSISFDDFKKSPFLSGINKLKNLESLNLMALENWLGEIEAHAKSKKPSKDKKLSSNGAAGILYATQNLFNTKILFLDNMLFSLSTYSKLLHEARGEINSADKKAQGEIRKLDLRIEDNEKAYIYLLNNLNELKILRNNLHISLLELQEGLSDCIYKLVDNEKKIKNKFVEIESEYLKDVHASMTALNVLDNDIQIIELEQLKTAIKETDVIDEVKNRSVTLINKVISDGLNSMPGTHDELKIKLENQLNLLLRVNTQAESDKSGIRIREKLYKDGQEIQWQGESRFNHQKFTSYEIDYFFRVLEFSKFGYNTYQQQSGGDRKYIEAVYPDFSIRMADNFWIWKGSYKAEVPINYKKDPKEFIKDALSYFSKPAWGPKYWFTNNIESNNRTDTEVLKHGGEDVLHKLLLLGAELYRAGPVYDMPGDISKCKSNKVGDEAKNICPELDNICDEKDINDKKCVAKTSKSLLNDINNLYKAIRITDDDLVVLDQILVDKKYHNRFFEKTFYRETDSSVALYNILFKKISTIIFPGTSSKEGHPFDTQFNEVYDLYKEEGEMFLKYGFSNYNLSTSIFEYNHELINYMRKKYRGFIDSAFRRTFDLRDEIKSEEIRDAVNQSPKYLRLERHADSMDLSETSNALVNESFQYDKWGWKTYVSKRKSITIEKDDRDAQIDDVPIYLSDSVYNEIIHEMVEFFKKSNCVLLPRYEDEANAKLLSQIKSEQTCSEKAKLFIEKQLDVKE